MENSNGVRNFFERLMEDDDFRESVIRDPRRVMQDYGIEYVDEDIPDEVVLPSKEDLKEHFDDFIEQLGEEPVSFGVWMFIVKPPAAE